MAGSGRDSGAVVIGWFVRIAITLALFGTVAFDGISIALARTHIDQVTGDSADAALAAYSLKHQTQDALAAAMSQAASEGGFVTPRDLSITRTGTTTTIRLTVHITAKTAVIGHLPGTIDLNKTSGVAVRTVEPQ